MADWRKTKCCGTCALFNLNALKNKAGRVSSSGSARCGWKSIEVYPSSIRIDRGRPTPNYMSRDDGADCGCYEPGKERIG